MLRTITTLLLALSTLSLIAQDTFSIVAVDSITGEIGSAGASCLDNIQFPGSNGAYIISDIIPGRGAIHTQAAWSNGNQNRAHDKMVEGLSPAEIIAFMQTNDINQFNANNRQYGVVDFSPTGSPRSAAHTGIDCFDYKNHNLGINYAIQGNILLGQKILDSMEYNFLNTNGTLADKLMAALQGANVPGADTRCLSNGTSSLSAFLRVAKPNDDPNNIYIDLNVPSLPAGQEPIDSVQTLYDTWLLTDVQVPAPAAHISIYPNPSSNGRFYIESSVGQSTAAFYNLQGQQVRTFEVEKGRNSLEVEGLTGVYFVRVFSAERAVFWVVKVVFQD